jgi:F-type H+-transporting ATPase subunit b
MLIDGFTVAAQLVNFLVLVWLLKRFLYQPILQALAAREAKIASELNQADEQKRLAELQREAFLFKNQQFEQEKAALMAHALAEVKTEQQRLLDAARQDAEALRAKSQQALAAEYQALSETLVSKMQTEIFAVAAKTLSDLANVKLNEQITEVFIQRLQQLSASEQEQWLTMLANSDTPLRVRTAFPLSSAQQILLQQPIQQFFARDVVLEFEVAPSLISGIELIGNGQKFAWNIHGYLNELETRLHTCFQPTVAEKRDD